MNLLIIIAKLEKISATIRSTLISKNIDIKIRFLENKLAFSRVNYRDNCCSVLHGKFIKRILQSVRVDLIYMAQSGCFELTFAN